MIKSINAGGFVAVIVILLSLIEITPIKISPLAWVGRRVNKDVNDRLDKLESNIDKTNSKLDEHVAESYRNSILNVQDKLLHGDRLTKEEWKKAIKSCQAYDRYIKDNHLDNDLVEEAMAFIHRCYTKALDSHDFVELN